MKIAAITLIVIVLTVLFIYSKRQDGALKSRAEVPVVSPESARPDAPQINLIVEGKGIVELNRLTAPLAHIVFWAEWCDPCRREMPALARLAKSRRGHYNLILINLDEDNEARNRARQFVKDNFKDDVNTIAQVYSGGDKLTETFKVEALPYHLVVTNKNKIAATFVTSIEDDEPKFNSLLDSLEREN